MSAIDYFLSATDLSLHFFCQQVTIFLSTNNFSASKLLTNCQQNHSFCSFFVDKKEIFLDFCRQKMINFHVFVDKKKAIFAIFADKKLLTKKFFVSSRLLLNSCRWVLKLSIVWSKIQKTSELSRDKICTSKQLLEKKLWKFKKLL